MCTTPSTTLITVDSTPISTFPPSITYSTFPSSSSIISSTCVPLGLPDIFALGAAIGQFEYSISFRAIPSLGILIATVSSPPVMISGTIGFFLKTIVSGPGQKFFISFCSISPTSVTSSWSMSIFAIWAISGLSLALPFAMYIFFTASTSKAFAPNP